MMNMQFVLLLLSMVTLSTAAPQNFTAHFQIFKASPADPTPTSTNATINADGATRITGRATRATTGASNATTGASNATDNVTEASIDIRARTDRISQTVESTTNLGSGTTTEEADDESSTKAVFRTGGGVRTTTGSAVHEDRSKNQGTPTKTESGEVQTEEPGIGFNFKLPPYFLTFLQKSPTNRSESTTSSEISHHVRGTDDSNAISNAHNFNGGLTTDSTQPPNTFKSSTTTFTNTTTSPFVAASTNSSRHNVLSTSDYNNQNTVIPSGSFDAPKSSNHNVLSTSNFNHQNTISPSSSFDAPKPSRHNELSTSDFHNQHTVIPSGHNVLSTSDFNNKSTVFPSGSFDAPKYSGHNVLSIPEFNNPQSTLRPEHSVRLRKSLAESKLSSNHEANAPPSLHLNPDYYVAPLIAVGEGNSNTYNNDYYSQSFPQVRTPVVYEAATSHSGNNGGHSGQFQYIIRTANLPGMLATFPASDSTSAVHSSSPDAYPSQGVPSTGFQSGVRHVSLASQPASHVSLLPNFHSSSNINLTSSPEPSFGFANSSSGSSTSGHQQTMADSASGTSRPDGTSNSTTTETSIAFHAGHQQTKAGSASRTHSSNETYYSTTTMGSISSQETNKSFSTT